MLITKQLWVIRMKVFLVGDIISTVELSNGRVYCVKDDNGEIVGIYAKKDGEFYLMNLKQNTTVIVCGKLSLDIRSLLRDNGVKALILPYMIIPKEKSSSTRELPF